MNELYKSMKTSRNLENEGIWLDLDHSLIRLARAGGQNVKFNAAAEKLGREHKRVFQLDLMSSAKGKELLRALYADTVVLDWWSKDDNGTHVRVDGELEPVDDYPVYDGPRYTRGIGQPDGSIGEFNRSNVIATFTEIEDLLIICKETAESLTYFRKGLVEETAGN